MFTIVAHRGDSAAAPENTFEAFDLALQQGFYNFETDCQLTRDGVAVVLHDEQLGRTNNGNGAVAEHCLDQLLKLDAGSWFSDAYAGARIPTLVHLLRRYHNQAHMHLELKSQQPQLPAVVARLVKEHNWEYLQTAVSSPPVRASFAVPGLTITSFHVQQLKASKRLLPDVPHGWLVHELNRDVTATAKHCGFEMLCPRANALTADATAAAIKAGFVLRAWGVKTIELLDHAVKCGVHGATVNWPGKALQCLQQQQ